nr:MAG TPA: hypothetical protein [Caudoviricetes sp.]
MYPTTTLLGRYIKERILDSYHINSRQIKRDSEESPHSQQTTITKRRLLLNLLVKMQDIL